MSEASNTARVPLDASTREALERVRQALPKLAGEYTTEDGYRYVVGSPWRQDRVKAALTALALIESTLGRLEQERDAALEAERLIHERSEEAEVAWGAAEDRAERYAKALRHELGVTHGEDTIRRIRAALIPETEQPDFWRPDGRCPEC